MDEDTDVSRALDIIAEEITGNNPKSELPLTLKITAGEETVQQQLAFPKLQRLPAGLTEQILPEVCADIRLKPNAI